MNLSGSGITILVIAVVVPIALAVLGGLYGKRGVARVGTILMVVSGAAIALMYGREAMALGLIGFFMALVGVVGTLVIGGRRRE